MTQLQDMFDAAVRSFERGHALEAESLCHQVLQAQPRHLSALQMLGVLSLNSRRDQLAVEYFSRALTLDEHAISLTNVGEAYRRLRRHSDAGAALERAVSLDPGIAEAHFNLGVLRLEEQNLVQAELCFRRALDLKPRRAIFHRGLGSSLLAAGELGLAEQSLRAALALDPSLVGAHFELASTLHAQGNLAAAARHYELGLRIDPGNATGHCNFATTLMALTRIDESIASLKRSLELEPDVAAAHTSLGNALRASGQVEAAEVAYRRALALEPTNGAAHSALLFSLSFHPDHDDASIVEEARAWERQHASSITRLSRVSRPRDRNGGKLRIGYVSADFRYNVVSLFMLPLIEEHDRSRFEIFCYANSRVADDVTDRYRSLVDNFRDISKLEDDAASRLIQKDDIDVLVDLTMHSARGRPLLFARKPAPVQVCWLAYPGTTGLSAIDYRLTDPYIDPLELSSPSAERSWRLPHTFWCFRPFYLSPEEVPEPGPLPALTNGYVTFGSLNQFAKVNARTLSLWAKALRAVEGSRLLLHAPEGDSRDRVRARFEGLGVASERIEFVGAVSRRAYFETYHRIDVCLDTLPFSGHTTSLEGWYMGVPVLSLAGRTIGGRGGVCISRNLGLPQWGILDEEAYVGAARALTRDWHWLADLRASLRARLEASPLMDARLFADSIESAFEGMWTELLSAQQEPSAAGTDAQ